MYKFLPFKLMTWALPTLILASCAHKMPIPIETLKGVIQPHVVVSRSSPHEEYFCKSLGFLPCSLGDKHEEPVVGREHLQCAKNLLMYAERMGTNYIHMAMPVQMLGISWRDAKANLYDCQYLPQPSKPSIKSFNLPSKTVDEEPEGAPKLPMFKR